MIHALNHSNAQKEYSLTSLDHHVNHALEHKGGVEYVELFEINTVLRTIFSVVFNLISLVSILGNLLIILAVLRCKRMHNVTNYFIVNLAIADIIVSTLATPFQVRL